jgi:hypothetical protein
VPLRAAGEGIIFYASALQHCQHCLHIRTAEQSVHADLDGCCGRYQAGLWRRTYYFHIAGRTRFLDPHVEFGEGGVIHAKIFETDMLNACFVNNINNFQAIFDCLIIPREHENELHVRVSLLLSKRSPWRRRRLPVPRQ